MRRTLTRALVACSALALATAASAADLPAKSGAYFPAYTAPFSWSGFYVGINGGGASGTAIAPGTSWHTSGALIGATLGYNWQSGNWVYGVEGDADWLTVKGSPAAGVDSRITSLYTARARVGYAFDRVLPYITGGLAGGTGSISVAGVGSDRHFHTGYTVGGGLEYAFDRNWSAKAEYLYVDLGNKDYTINGYTVSGKSNVNIVRLGLNYRF